MFRLEANSTKEQSAPDGTCNKLERPALTCLAQKPGTNQPPDEPVADALVRARWILSTIRHAIFKLQDVSHLTLTLREMLQIDCPWLRYLNQRAIAPYLPY